MTLLHQREQIHHNDYCFLLTYYLCGCLWNNAVKALKLDIRTHEPWILCDCKHAQALCMLVALSGMDGPLVLGARSMNSVLWKFLWQVLLHMHGNCKLPLS